MAAIDRMKTQTPDPTAMNKADGEQQVVRFADVLLRLETDDLLKLTPTSVQAIREIGVTVD